VAPRHGSEPVRTKVVEDQQSADFQSSCISGISEKRGRSYSIRTTNGLSSRNQMAKALWRLAAVERPRVVGPPRGSRQSAHIVCMAPRPSGGHITAWRAPRAESALQHIEVDYNGELKPLEVVLSGARADG